MGETLIAGAHRSGCFEPVGCRVRDRALRKKAPTLPHSICGSGARWCARAAAISDVPDTHVLDIELDVQQRLGARASFVAFAVNVPRSRS